MTNPAIPGTPTDRTGSAGIQRRAMAEIKRRYAALQADVLALFAAIPVYALNDEFGQVLYGLTPEQMQRLSDDLKAAFERWVASGRDPANTFWWSGYVSDSAQMGAAQAAANLANLSTVYAAARSIEQIVYSQPYQTRLALAQIKSYEHWTGLAATQKSELAQIIGRAVVDGKNPKAVRTEIMERLDVSRGRAAGYAQTDVADTLRQARTAEAEYAMETLHLKIGLLWTSAFKKTTRSWHAARSGKVYSPEEVKVFYASNGNRYRCFCATTEALLDTDGKPILSKKLQASMANERKTWQSAQANA